MTRVLVLSNSHGSALRHAKDAFSAEFPEVKLDFFGVTGPMLKMGHTDKTGVFHPYSLAHKRMNILNTVDDASEINLRNFDVVLTIGFQSWPIYVGKSFDGFRITPEKAADFPENAQAGAQWMSRGLFQTILKDTTEKWAKNIAQRFPNCPNLVITPTPAPSETIGARKDFALAKDVMSFIAHQDAAEITQTHLELTQKAAAEAGFEFLPQPETTRSYPYGTKAEFADRRTKWDGTDLGIKDHRHMNKAYGLEVLRSFASEHLGLSAKAA